MAFVRRGRTDGFRIKLIRKLFTDQLDSEAIRTSAMNKRHLRTLFAVTDHRKA